MKHRPFRGYFIAGLLIWLPIWATLLVIGFIVDLLDGSLSLLPAAYHPDHLLGFHLPGLGVVLSVLVVFSTGVLATNIIGRHLVHWGESLVARIPLVSSIYHAVKQVLQSLFQSSGQSFRRVLLVEYPRKGLWSIAFQTGTGNEEVNHHTGQQMLTIFIPTTPNPTSGFLMMVAEENTVELKMSIDEALKFVISLGVVQSSSFTSEINKAP